MAMTREDMLRELELLPAWKLREPLPFTAVPAILTPTEAPAVIEVTVPVEVVEPELVSNTLENAEQGSLLEGRIETIKQMDWQSLQAYVQECQFFNVAASRANATFGAGDVNADWLIVGEVSAAENDGNDELIANQVSHLLSNMLAAIQLKRGTNVYISNVLKRGSADSNVGIGEEAIECAALLKRQVELIQPKLIIALGEFAAQSLLHSENTLASMRGQLHQYNGVPVIVTYHPAYLLRNLADKAKAWEDLCFARKTMQNL